VRSGPEAAHAAASRDRERRLPPTVAAAPGPPPPRHALSDPRSILITGASSGIGAVLARGYASPGRTLVLAGCDGTRLEEAAARCRLICKLRKLANAGSDLAAS
jgi:hypothetical protein